MKDRKGFTLIELLAVIVILAIIALIATPIILNIINDSKKKAAIDSVYGYIDAIEFNNAMVELSDKYNTKVKSGDTIEILNSFIKVKGDKPNKIEDLVIIKDKVESGNFCLGDYNINYSSNKAKVTGNCGVITPTLNIESIISTTSSVKINYETINTSKVICKYDDKEINGTLTSCEITGLKNNQEYTYEIEATSKKGEKTTISGTFKTNDYGEVSIVEDTSNWSTSKEVTITGETSGAKLQYQIGKTDGEWIDIENNKTINITENTIVYARLYDGKNVVENPASLVITTIDNTEPTISLNSSLPSSMTKGDSNTIIGNYSTNIPSGYTTECKSNKDGIVSNTNQLKTVGSHTLTCTITTGSGKTTTASKDINVTYTAYTAKNIVVNGNFENGNNGWFLENTSINCSIGYNNSCGLVLQHNNGNAYTAMSTQSISAPIVGHKYYGTLMFKSSNNFSAVDSRFEMFNTDALNALIVFTQKNGSFVDWTKLSSIGFISADTYINKPWIIRNFSVSANNYSYCDNVLIIDLTATFGSGNEPSKEWCDSHINYFDGTTTIYK